MKLHKLTSLGDSNPLQRYLKIVDRFLGDQDWLDAHRKLTKEELLRGIWLCLGHPVYYPLVRDDNLDNLEKYLTEKGEPILAEIVSKMRKRVGEQGLDQMGIRVVMMWLMANLEYIKEQYLKEQERLQKPRRITTEFTPSKDA